MKTRITLLILATCMLVVSLHAQWTQTSGPEGGYAESFTTIGTTIYAASFIGGVFKSTDSGDHWMWSGNGIPVGTDSRSIATDGSILYVGTTNGVYKSVDGGATWSASSTGITNTNLKAVFVSGSWVYAGIQGTGVFRSSNQGAVWEADTVGLDPSGLIVRSFVSIGSALFVGTAGGVFRSTNNGSTWTPANSGLTSTDINTLAIFNGTLLAGTGLNGVFRSTDNGSSWSGGQSAITLALAVIGSDVFEATLGGVMRSTDGGATWNSANTGIPPTNNCRSLGVLGTTLFVGMGNNGDKGGIYRTTNLGGNWVEKNTGYINTQVYTLLKVTSGLFAGCADGSLYKSTDNGTTWTFLRNFGTGITSQYEGGTYMYVGTGASGGNVYRSTDAGVTWNYAGTGLPASGTIRGLVGIGGYIIAGCSSGGIYRTLDATWSASNSGLTSTVVNALTTFGIYTYAGTNGGFFISTNSGANWTISNSGLTTLNVQSIVSPGASIIYVGTLGGGVFKSTDNGASWIAVNSGLTATQVKTLAAAGSTIIAGTTLGVFVSTNAGANWTASNTGLSNTTIQCLNLDTHNDIVVGTLGNGAWRRPYSQLTAVLEVHEDVPVAFTLAQNYPNPFNPSTTIRFTIPAATKGRTSLQVFDQLGKEVLTLVNGELDPGAYETTFSPTNLATGIYYYTLTVGRSTQTRKLILMK